MNISIRKARENELEIIQDLNHQLFLSDSHYNSTLNLNWPYEEGGIKYFKSRIEGKNSVCFVAEVDGEVVGYLMGGLYDFQSWKPVKKTELESMIVNKDFRNQGIGEKLVENFIEWSKEQGVERITVGTAAKNEGAVKFYQRLGFDPDQIYLEAKIGD